MTEWEAVSRRIRQGREALGLTQDGLGARVGSSANYVAQVEGGLAISEKKLALYAQALGVSVPWLRYGVAEAIDVEAIQRMARAEARAQLLTELSAWIVAAASPAPPRHETLEEVSARTGIGVARRGQQFPAPESEKATRAGGQKGGKRNR